MNLLIFSDTHGFSERMADVIDRKRLWADLVIHLGDHYTDLQNIRDCYPTIAFLGVRGNCDWRPHKDFPLENHLCLDGHTLYFTHGHTLDVKSSKELLVYKAKSFQADLALFGHTHVPFLEVIDGVTLLNPGSLTDPRGGSAAGYATVVLTPGKVPACALVPYEA